MNASRLRGVMALLLIFAVLLCNDPPRSEALDTTPAGTPTPDRLATPPMPESPSQIDIGRNLYYYHCMPCHGDRGQGLTDEWRQVWVHDHQNCWGRGCHTGRAGEEGFFIPRFVPPVSGTPQTLKRFQTSEELFAFLRRTQPPQRPGALSDDEYWALTAFLLDENGRRPPELQLGPDAAGQFTAVAMGLLLLMLLALWAGKRLRK